MKNTKILVFWWLLFAGWSLPLAAFGSESIITVAVDEEFSNVRIDIENAIANRGFVVDFHSKIGEMLDRTAVDVGSNDRVYMYAETWQFCSSVLSREMVEEDPVNIAYCPYIIFAFETVDNPGTVVVGYRAHDAENDASKKILDEIDQHLDSIVQEVVE